MVAALSTSFRTFNRSIRLFLLANILLGLSVDGVYAVLFNLYLLRLGYTSEFIGLANAAGLFSFALAGFLAGLSGSRWGSRRVMLLGASLLLTAGVLLPLAESAPTGWQDSWIVVTYVLLLGGFAFFFVGGSPFMMGSAQVQQRNALFAIHSAVSSMAAFGGSLLGGALPGLINRLSSASLTEPAPYRYPMQLLVVFMLPALFLTYATIDPRPEFTTRSAQQGKQSRNWRRLPLLLVSMIALIRLLQVAGLGATSTFINVYLDTDLLVPTARIGLITSLSRLLGVPAALLVPRLTERFGNVRVALVGSLGAALFIVPIAFVPLWTVAGAAFIGTRIMTNIRFPAFQVYIMEMFEPDLQSMLSGVMALAAGLSFALMALGGGYVIAHFNFQSLFLAGASITFLGTVILYLFYRHSAATDEA